MASITHQLCVCLILCLKSISAIPIDNGVMGDPEIECGPATIGISFNVQNEFEGHVYVKGRYADRQCRETGDGTRKIAQLELGFNECGVRRWRSLNPKGIFVSSTVVITFHPSFLTKIDRAFTVQCFYMEADKTVSSEIEVSMITTGFQTQTVPMPICRYEILDGPSGNPVRYVLIGQAVGRGWYGIGCCKMFSVLWVYHKWTCDSDTQDTFCMFVHFCFVDDGNGDRLDLIDPNGCGLDPYLLNHLDYLSDLMVGQESHVFKYADRPALYFQCQISITVKEPNEPCARPQCDSLLPRRLQQQRRVQRSTDTETLRSSYGIVDVATKLTALELDDKDQQYSDADQNLLRLNQISPALDRHQQRSAVCISHHMLLTTLVCLVAGLLAVLGSVVLTAYRQYNSRDKY